MPSLSATSSCDKANLERREARIKRLGLPFEAVAGKPMSRTKLAFLTAYQIYGFLANKRDEVAFAIDEEIRQELDRIKMFLETLSSGKSLATYH
jgi:hypothetical protein